MRTNRLGLAAAIALGLAGIAGASTVEALPGHDYDGRREPVDPAQVQALATWIVNALTPLCPTANAHRDVETVRAVLRTADVNAAEAEAALSLAQRSTDLCQTARFALASLDEQSEQFAAGGRGGGEPIGPPPVYVGGGGSNYDNHGHH